MSLHLRGRVVTKGREIIIFAKSQPPFDVHRQYLDVSLTDSQARVQGFAVEFFTVLWISRNLARLSLVFIFKNYRHMIFLHLESFENKLVD